MKAINRVYPLASVLFVLVFSQFIASCKQSSSPSDVQPGSITGVVSLGNENGSSSPGGFPSSEGAAVALDGTAFSTTTDSSGFWKFDNVPGGNYNVAISKSGFGLTRIYGVTIEGPGTTYIPQVDLGSLPTAGPTITSANIANIMMLTVDTLKTGDTQLVSVPQPNLEIRWSTPLDRDYAGLCIYLDKDSLEQPADVHWFSYLNGTQPWNGWFDDRTSDTTLPFSSSNSGLMACPVSALHAAGIPSGTTVYITLAQYDPYPINGKAPNNTFTYYDPVHNQNRLISPSPRSNVIAVTVP